MEEIQTQQKPDNFLVWAILTTLFCCLPFGFAAIIYSSKVDSEWNAGHYEAAISAAASAKKWTLIGAAVGAGAILLYVFFIITVAVVAVASASGSM